MKINEDINL